MFIVGILAALGPARRGLAVQPTEALREEWDPRFLRSKIMTRVSAR